VRGEFHLEWGYLAPAPSFPTNVRAATEVSVAVWLTLEKTTPAPTIAPTAVATRTTRALWCRGYIGAWHHVGPGRPDEPTIANREAATSELKGQAVDVATSESSASSTTRAPEGVAALAKASPAASGPPALSAAAKAHVANVTPIRKRAMTKRVAP
jgi:hypothetical protein